METKTENIEVAKTITKAERRWIDSVIKIMSRKPDSILLYSIDHGILACKRGVGSNDFCEAIEESLQGGAHIRDIHDNWQMTEENRA